MALGSSTSISRNWGVIEALSSSGSCSSHKLSRVFLQADGTFPNNPDHPVMMVLAAFHGTTAQAQALLTGGNQWTSPWIWGIYPFHHYHSTAWELLLCIDGQADIQLGGPSGPELSVTKGDWMLIPPGVAHKQLRDNGHFNLLGSYPMEGCSGPVDTLKGSPTQEQVVNMQACAAPQKAPIMGLDLREFYK